jgi:hypothetical protein
MIPNSDPKEITKPRVPSEHCQALHKVVRNLLPKAVFKSSLVSRYPATLTYKTERRGKRAKKH